jgi:hypothetical protein
MMPALGASLKQKRAAFLMEAVILPSFASINAISRSAGRKVEP